MIDFISLKCNSEDQELNKSKYVIKITLLTVNICCFIPDLDESTVYVLGAVFYKNLGLFLPTLR